MLAPLAARADDRDFMRQIFALAKDPANDPSLLDSPDRLLERAKATPSSMLASSGQFQSLLFGNGLSSLNDGLARYAGIKLVSRFFVDVAGDTCLACSIA